MPQNDHSHRNRKLHITEDGSHTLFVPELDESYHSVYGAIQESQHVFLKHGFQTIRKSRIRILETGFGTGLNVLLTLAEAARRRTVIYYHTVDKYPVEANEYKIFNYEQFIEGIPGGTLIRMHEAQWNKEIRFAPHFSFYKELSDFRDMNPQGPFDLVYYDAFDPQKQPDLWTEDIFCRISRLLNPGGILVSYTSKGSVRRALESCGFHVEKIPGPPGKREMIRAIRS